MRVSVMQLIYDFVMLLANCCDPKGELHRKYGRKSSRRHRTHRARRHHTTHWSHGSRRRRTWP